MKKLYILLPYFETVLPAKDVQQIRLNPGGITGKGGVSLDKYFLPDIEKKKLDALNISLTSEQVVSRELRNMIDSNTRKRKIKFARDHDKRKQDIYENINQVAVNRFATDIDFPYMDVIDLFSLFESKQVIKSYEHDLDTSNRTFDLSSLTKFIVGQYRTMRTIDQSTGIGTGPFQAFRALKESYSNLFYKNIQYKVQLLREVVIRTIEKTDDRRELTMVTKNILRQILLIIGEFGEEVKNPIFYDFILRYINMFDRNRSMVVKQRNAILKENLIRHSSFPNFCHFV
jgi:hypothetical protein